MVDAFEDIWSLAKEYEVDMRTAAYMMSIKRIADAMKMRGWYSDTPQTEIVEEKALLATE
jgi:glutamate dehydrogenase